MPSLTPPNQITYLSSVEITSASEMILFIIFLPKWPPLSISSKKQEFPGRNMNRICLTQDFKDSIIPIQLMIMSTTSGSIILWLSLQFLSNDRFPISQSLIIRLVCQISRILQDLIMISRPILFHNGLISAGKLC